MSSDPLAQKPRPILPVEVEVIISPTGEVIFADLEASLVEVARAIAPEDNNLTASDGADAETV